MGIIMLLLGALCLAYFAALLMIGMDFSIIWLFGAIVLMAAGGIVKLEKWTPPAPLRICLGIFIGLCLIIFLAVEGLIFTKMFSKGEKGLDYLVILGAQVRGTEPSRALKKRLDAAYSYMQENPDTKAVVSGGMGAGEEITEAKAMYDYLCEKGIDSDRIIMEDRSTSTVENLQFTAELVDKTSKIGLVTNNFHVYRALKLAKKQGYTEVCGMAAPSDPWLQPHYLVREFFALIKEWAVHNI